MNTDRESSFLTTAVTLNAVCSGRTDRLTVSSAVVMEMWGEEGSLCEELHPTIEHAPSKTDQ